VFRNRAGPPPAPGISPRLTETAPAPPDWGRFFATRRCEIGQSPCVWINDRQLRRPRFNLWLCHYERIRNASYIVAAVLIGLAVWFALGQPL
jgi:hypothetical protein